MSFDPDPWPTPKKPEASPDSWTNPTISAGTRVMVNDGMHQAIGVVVGESDVDQKRPLVQFAQLRHGTGVFSEELLVRADGKKKKPLKVGVRVWFKKHFAISGIIAVMNFNGGKNHLVHYSRILHGKRKVDRRYLHRIDKDPEYDESKISAPKGPTPTKRRTRSKT